MKTPTILASVGLVISLLASAALLKYLVTSSDWYVRWQFNRNNPLWAGADPLGKRDSSEVFRRVFDNAKEGDVITIPNGLFIQGAPLILCKRIRLVGSE